MKDEQDERSHFEIMEELGQLSIFDVLGAEMHPKNDVEDVVNIGDKVKILISEDDVDAFNYFKYYYPHFLEGIGKVVAKEGRLYKVRVKSDVLLFHRHELVV